MKYIIKSCNDRLWYVNKILIPDMLSQGIKESDIILMNDNDSIGCLWHWIRICETQINIFKKEKGVWHLQDDILISSSFKDVTQNTPNEIVCNGFVPKTQPNEDSYRVGIVPVKDYWTSFPCIYIPNSIVEGFLKWFKVKVINEGKYSKLVEKGKYEDTLFWQFMKEEHTNEKIFNIAPNIVQHVDYLLGGSIVNKHFKKGTVTACYWTEEQREQELVDRIWRIKNDCK